MPRVLTEAIFVFAFAAPIGAGCLQAWPLITTRPLPTGLDVDAVFLAAFTLLCSLVATTLMSVHIRSA
jgi:hypothetical protein